MTTPQAVLDKIAELEAEIQESATEMIRTSGVIADLRQVQESEEAVQATARNALDLLRFVVGEYEIQEQGIPIYVAAPQLLVIGNTSSGETVGNGFKPTSTKERVYAAMAQLEGPATATQIAEAIGATDYRTVAPVFAVLRKEGKIKPSDGGWIRTAALALGLFLAASNAQAQYLSRDGINLYTTSPPSSMSFGGTPWAQQPQPSYSPPPAWNPPSTYLPQSNGRCLVPAAGC